jgi:hypothetical protein
MNVRQILLLAGLISACMPRSTGARDKACVLESSQAQEQILRDAFALGGALARWKGDDPVQILVTIWSAPISTERRVDPIDEAPTTCFHTETSFDDPRPPQWKPDCSVDYFGGPRRRLVEVQVITHCADNTVALVFQRPLDLPTKPNAGVAATQFTLWAKVRLGGPRLQLVSGCLPRSWLDYFGPEAAGMVAPRAQAIALCNPFEVPNLRVPDDAGWPLLPDGGISTGPFFVPIAPKNP